MPKWTSPLFSDIRNALGESVVFSMWKGRPYMRSWVRPANPQTNKQSANRAVMDALVARWQAIVTTEDIKGQYNARALPYTISGFNIFTKFGMLSQVACPATGSTTASFDVTYTSGIPAGDARLYAYDGTDWTDETPVGGLEAGADNTAAITLATAGTYTLYLADSKILVDGDSAPQNYQAITSWSKDELNGVAKVAEITIS